MYELPKDVDLSAFVGKDLELICCSVNQVIFRFSGELSIVALAQFDYTDTKGSDYTFEVPLSNAAILGLLGHRVTRVRIPEGNRDLVLEFRDNRSLTFSSDETYEAFHLHFGSKEYFV